MKTERSTSLTLWRDVRKYSQLLSSINAAKCLTIMHEIFDLIWLLKRKS